MCSKKSYIFARPVIEPLTTSGCSDVHGSGAIGLLFLAGSRRLLDGEGECLAVLLDAAGS